MAEIEHNKGSGWKTSAVTETLLAFGVTLVYTGSAILGVEIVNPNIDLPAAVEVGGWAVSGAGVILITTGAVHNMIEN